jgi:hypothetical protein
MKKMSYGKRKEAGAHEGESLLQLSPQLFQAALDRCQRLGSLFGFIVDFGDQCVKAVFSRVDLGMDSVERGTNFWACRVLVARQPIGLQANLEEYWSQFLVDQELELTGDFVDQISKQGITGGHLTAERLKNGPHLEKDFECHRH